MKSMGKIFMAAIFLVLAASNIAASATDSVCDTACLNARQIFEQDLSTVLILVKNEKGGASGTGVVIKVNETSYILTNNHVVEKALRIWISFYKHDVMYETSIVGRDSAADLALLNFPLLPFSIKPVVFGKLSGVGEKVYALGYPFGVMRSVTEGIVNAPESISWLYFLIQAPINFGNSGGPLFNSKWEMIGINTARVDSKLGSGMGFVLSIDYIKKLLPRLVREKVVSHGDTDFVFSDTSKIPPSFFEENGMSYPPEKNEVMVVDVPKSSSAETAGFRQGDVIVEFNGSAVRSARELDMKIFFEYRSSDEVVFVVKRGGQIFEKRLKLGEYISPLSKRNNEE